MASPEEISQQRELLATHRLTLAHYLKQQAALGAAHAPPGVAHGIREARDSIRRIKGVLRGWGAQADDHPDDDDVAAAAPPAANGPAEPIDRRALRDAIVQAFSLEDLDVLCDDVERDLDADRIKLAVNMELVGGQGKTGKVLNLIGYLDRRGYLEYLVRAVRRARPGII